MVDIALARLPSPGSTDGTSAADQLLSLAADAERRQFLGWALEAKLAAWELMRGKRANAAASLRTQIEKSARQHGFGRILNQLARDDRTAAQSDTQARAGI